jgi:LCP family protein required for cell wall assembly
MINRDLSAQIETIEVDRLIPEDDRPEFTFTEDGRAMTVLVLGTDYRGAENQELFGGSYETVADTTFIMNIPASREWVEIVSLPRDSLVQIPACRRSDGSEAPAMIGQFNLAFARGAGTTADMAGAVACAVKTVESLTGLRITDHILLEMTGVISVVDALGGVDVELPEAVRGNRYVDLDLPAGAQTLNGWQAINFVRARGGTGMGLEMGSDLTRIERQQFFLGELARDLMARDLIGDAPRLYRTLAEALGSMSTNPALGSPFALGALATSFSGFDADTLIFTSLPVVAAPSDPNRVVWTHEADAIFDRIRSGGAPPQIAAHEGSEQLSADGMQQGQ